jgi:hypothetical protein
MADPAIVSDAAALQAQCEALNAAHAHVEKLYARWTKLEEKRTEGTPIG